MLHSFFAMLHNLNQLSGNQYYAVQTIKINLMGVERHIEVTADGGLANYSKMAVVMTMFSPFSKLCKFFSPA